MKGIKGRNLVLATTAAFLVVYFLATNIYSSSNSALYLHLFITSLFFAATNILLISLKRIGIPKKSRTVKVKRRKDIKTTKTDIEIEQAVASHSKKLKLDRFKNKFNINPLIVKKVIRFAVYAFVVFSCINNAAFSLSAAKAESEVSLGHAVISVIVLAAFVVLDKLCKHSADNSEFVTAMLKNCRLFIKLLSFQLIITIISTLLCSFEIFDANRYAAYFMFAFFVYCLIFTAISLVIIVLKKDSAKQPYIKIVIPFSKEDRSYDFVEFLESSTGITMRSLWSVKYIKKISPVIVLAVAGLLWLTTGVVQVGPQQQAAVYRLGVLQDKLLDSGLHFVLPYPFDRAEIYDTETVQKMTIGYKSSEASDNIWTASHGSDEYKLLLGNGDELVSINLRLEYKISDLKKYLMSASEPEQILQALAYELVTDKTIQTDLSTLLSADRDAFADNFRKELDKKLSAYNTGLEVVCVILESIHPPVEISSVYQQIISAEITAEKYILDAQAKANVTLANAQAKYDTAVNTANAENSEKVAAAKTSVAEFTASLQAFNKYGEKYKYQKYLTAVREAYGKANLVILSDDVDGSAIYFGSISNGTLLTPETDNSTATTPETSE